MAKLGLKFNPQWLKWFIDTLQQIQTGAAVTHNLLAGLQGGSGTDFYHVGAPGSAGKFARSDGSTWVASTLTLPDTIAAGALFFGSASNVVSTLAAAANGRVLTLVGGLPSWEVDAGGVTIGAPVTGGAANRVLYESAGNLVAESANFTFDGSKLALAANTSSGGISIGTAPITLYYNNSTGYGTLQAAGGAALGYIGAFHAFAPSGTDASANHTFLISGDDVLISGASPKIIFQTAGYLPYTEMAGNSVTSNVDFADGISIATVIELGHLTDTTLARLSAGNITVEGNLVWTAGNDGAGSGLAADTVSIEELYSISTLLHLDGADGSPTFTDSGTASVAFTGFGNAELDTAQPKFGTAAVYLDGTGSYISGVIGTRPSGSWTMSGWVRFDTILAFSNNWIFAWGTAGALAAQFRWNTSNWAVGLSSNGSTFDIGEFLLLGAPAPAVDTWIHWAVEFNEPAGEYYAYIDGVNYVTVTSSTLVYDNASNELFLGSNRGASQDFIGWMDEVAYFKQALYEGNDFTPPTSAYTSTSGPLYLTLATSLTIEESPGTHADLTYDPVTGTLTAPNFSGTFSGNADTVTFANEASDTSCFIAFATAASGPLEPKSNSAMTFNASTGVATFASTVLTTADINGGTIDGAVIGGASPAAITGLVVTANTGFMPDADDGAYLGQSGVGFSDLFLASGAVINFATANAVITHSSGIITVSTGDLRVTTAGTNAASAVTVGGTQTLTAKTLTTPDINGGTADSLTSLSVRSTGAAFDLLFASTEVLGANRTLTWVLGDAARTITLSGNPTLNDWFDQSVKAAASPQFAAVNVGDAADTTITRVSPGVIAVEGVTIATISGTQTLTGKTINLANNTLTGTLAEFNTALSDGNFATLAGIETLTNKTLTAPDINGGTADSLTSLSVRSTGAAFDLLFASAEVLGANRTLSWVMGDAARTITLSGNPTLGDWFDQSVKTGASPTFAAVTATTFTGALVGNAATVTHADETTDTSCFITFSTAASGPLPVKTNANLTFNSNTGVATFGQTIVGAISGNAGTATALQTARNIGGIAFDGTGDIVPATITVVDTTDSTCFVALFESASGSLGPKTDAGLTYDASTGILTAAGFSGAFNAATVTFANEAADTTCFLAFATAASGNLEPKTNVNMTFNSNTGVVTFASAVLTTADINGGTIDAVTIGGTSAAAITGTTITANTGFLPDADDGAYLGQSGTAFSDLFLASGAVVNFDAGNSVLTHSSAVLTVSTGDLRVTTAGTNAASAVTVGGTQTLTAKTLTTPDINGGTADSLTSLSVRSTGAAFDLLFASGEVITANRTLSWVMGNAARTITLSGSPTLSDWFDQSVKVAASPSFVDGTFSGDVGVNGGDLTSSATTFNLLNANVLTLNIASAATTAVRIGGSGAAFGFGVGTSGLFHFRFGGGFTSSGAATSASGLSYDGTLTGAAGDTARLSHLSFAPGALTTAGAGEVHAILATNYISEPLIALGAGDTATMAATLYLANAPTEGVTNAALAIGAGDFYTAGNVQIGSVTLAPAGDLDVTNVTGGVLTLRRDDNTIAVDEMIGKVQFYAQDTSTSTNFIAAELEAQATNAIGTNINPGRLVFRTTSTTVAALPADRLWIENDGTLRHFALFTSSTDYSRNGYRIATSIQTAVSGATVTATNLIPARAFLLGVNTKVTVALGTTSGTTGYQVGDGTTPARWGNITGTATTTDTDGSNATADPTGWALAARSVVLTANGGNFDGTGTIRIDAFYIITEAD